MTSIAAALQELEAERRRLDAAIAALKAILPPPPVYQQREKTIVGVTLAHLRKVGKAQTSRQLREAIASAGIKATDATIQTMLYRQVNRNRDLMKKGHGVWMLKEWKK